MKIRSQLKRLNIHGRYPEKFHPVVPCQIVEFAGINISNRINANCGVQHMCYTKFCQSPDIPCDQSVGMG